MDKSLFNFYSIGIVVKDKVRQEDTITVSPIEHLNVQSNQKLDSDPVTSKGTLSSPIAKPNFSSEISSSSNITAKWINLGGSNRITAPDVYKGETVVLYKYENVDEYYWSTIFREPSLRKQETVIYSYSNEKTPMKEFNPDSSYWFLVDTFGKMLKLHTSNNDKEEVKYDITMNTKEGTFEVFRDSNGNFMLLDSKQKTLTVYALKDITLLDSSGDYVKINSDSMSVTVNSGKSVIVNTKSVTVNASNTVINSPSNLVNGDLNVTGNVSVTGGLSSGGNASIGGSINSSGNISTNGNISAAGTVSGSNI
jgi:phage baseplate assembly protein gpV